MTRRRNSGQTRNSGRASDSGRLIIDSAAKLRASLKRLGLSDPAVNAAWPRWWSSEADFSASAQAELRFGIARRLGLDPASLLQDEPRFVWREEARFKGLRAEDDDRVQAGIASFGRAVAAAAIAATPPTQNSLEGVAAEVVRAQVLSDSPVVSLYELLVLSWAIGVPVVHLRIFPWTTKRMAAMTVRVGDRDSVLLAREAAYPAWPAFYLAHELGHIALGHVVADHTLVDLEADLDSQGSDEEEAAADRWALELLTGFPDPQVLSATGNASAAELARVSIESAHELHIEPGTLALCFGHTTRNWRVANGALKLIYTAPSPVWRAINSVARQQLDLGSLAPDAADFLEDVLDLQRDG